MSPLALQIVTLVGLPIAGAILFHLWSRYRGRMARLYWSAEHVSMALATPDTGFGEVQVLYNGQPTVNLHVTRVLLTNDSTRDLTDVVVRLTYLEGTRILRSFAFHPNTVIALPHSQAFTEQLALALAAQPDIRVIDYVFRNHEYRVPVLNRGASAQFGLLVTRDDHARPTVHLEVTHPGVRLEYKEPVNDVLGVRRSHAQVAGLLIGVAGLAMVVAMSPSPLVTGLAGWLLGGLGIAIGAAAVRVLRLISKLLS